jgi:outer membrane protein assembly factor BamB
VITFANISFPVLSSSNSVNLRLSIPVLQTKENAFSYETGITEYPWLQQAYDAQRTGYTESPAPVTNHTLWEFSGDGKDYYLSFPTIADGKVFLSLQIPLPYDRIYALDAATGEQIWTWRPEGLPIGSGFQASPVVDAGKIYYPTGTSLYCISEATGEDMWQYDFGRPLAGVHSVAVSGGIIYGFSTNSVWCIEAGYMTGYHPVLKWETFSNGNFTIDTLFTGLIGSPAVGEGKVVGIGKGSGDVFCLNSTTGEWMWTVNTGAITQYTPTIHDGKVYYGDNDGNLYCWNANTGAEIWKHSFSLGVCWSVAVAYDKVYAGAYDGWFRAFDANTGTVIWEINNTAAQASHPFLGYWGVWHAPPAVADNKVYLGGHDGYFYCWNASTGEEIWKYEVGGDVCAGPAIADGRVYVGSHYTFAKYEGQGTGTFYCFGKGPTKTEVSVTRSTVTDGSSTAIFGTVTDQSPAHIGEYVVGAQIKLSYQTDENWIDLPTVTTNSNGDFSYEWTPPAEGVYNIMACFEGDNNFEWSTSEIPIQVTSAPPPPPEFPEYGTSDFPEYPEGPTAEEVAQKVLDDLPEGPTAEEVAQKVLDDLPEGPTAEDVAQEVINQLPAYPEYPEAPEYTTMDLAIIAAVVVVAALVVYNIYTVRKRK